MRSEKFSFSFTENVSKFVILGRDIGQIRSFVELAWMFKEWRQSLKLLEPRSFDVCKNAAAPMIVMLDCLELDIEVSDAGMETMKSDDCREVSKKNGDTNGVLAIMWEGARFSCKDG